MADIQLREVVLDDSPVNKALFRNAIITRYPYCIADGENPSDLTVNEAGVVPLALAFNGLLFWLDAGDTSSGPPDNVTLIVTADGYRYFADGEYSQAYSVLSQGDNTPPMAPTVHDAYHTGPSPTGDWAGYPNRIAVYTRRGWLFQEIPVGKLIYVVDETSYYHLDENDDFVLGTGTAQLGAQTVRDTMLVGMQRFYTVENQTVTSPGAASSAPLGTYWIVGSGATGAWAGQDGKIATVYDGTNWAFLSPVEGWHAYDKALNSLYKFNGTDWQNASGAWVKNALTRRDADYSAGGGAGWQNILNITFQADKTGTNRFRIMVSFNGLSMTTGAGTGNRVLQLVVRRDSETNPLKVIDETTISAASTTFRTAKYTDMFFIDIPDTASHVYRLQAVITGTNITATTLYGPFYFSIEEAA